MRIQLIGIGKTQSPHILALLSEYEKRLGHFVAFERVELNDIKNAQNLSEMQLKDKEGDLILAQLQPSDVLVLLDDKGQSFTSKAFSVHLQKQMNQSIKKIVVVVGGAYGFSEEVYARSNQKWSLSAMTFTHQMVRLFFVEQLYRAFAIINHLPYHHE